MMKYLDMRRLRRAGIILSALVVATFFGACERLMDGEGYCPTVYKVKFRFTMNILETDAFASKVKSVSLFVFDKQGRCIDVVTETGAALAADDYAMVLEQPAGEYDLIAWCGLDGSEDFALARAVEPQLREDLICSLLPETRGETACQKPLAPLWHGRADNVVLPDETGEHVVANIDLTKNTNTVRIILQHFKGKALDPDDFDFMISDVNGIMNWDNGLLPCDEISYRAWSKIPAEVSMPDAEDQEAEKTAVSSLLAEIDVARLVKKDDYDTTITVMRAGQEKPLLRLPLIDLLLMAKGEARHKDDQEYLDRQDEYNLIFFLDDAGWYVNGGVWVNSWHVIDFSAKKTLQ